MVFKNFKFQIVLRVILLTSCIILLSWCLVNQLYLRSVYLAAAVIISVMELLWYIDRFNRDVNVFMNFLLQHDFTTHFKDDGRGKSFKTLYEMFNNISATFKKISAEKEIQHRYLEMLVEHVRVSIISIDAEERIHLANQAVKDLLQKNILTNLKTLESVDSSFVNTLREIRTGETRLVKLYINKDLLQLSIHASEFKLADRYYKLISMQNIRSELDSREMEAWQKLIRVLSHEIMNSVAPIISLSETLHGLVTQNSEWIKHPNFNLHEPLEKGLEAIKIRSEGLYNFTQTYRKLTGIPTVSVKLINLKIIIDRVSTLMQPKLRENNIALVTANLDVDVVVDPELMEHVLINLLLNAMEAVGSRQKGCITIRSSIHKKGNICIHIADNGEGIEEDNLEKIFIPFFTTRKNGSGIGLALTKQILQLHQADIVVTSVPGAGAEFVIVL